MKIEKAFWTIFILIVAVSVTIAILYDETPSTTDIKLEKFSSETDMIKFIEDNTVQQDYLWKSTGIMRAMNAPIGAQMDTMAVAESAGGSGDYSETNIQVQGVDEADIVKTDGKYIYTISNNDVIIVKAYPADDAEVVSILSFNSQPNGIYIHDNKLAVIYNDYNRYDTKEKMIAPDYYYPRSGDTIIEVYDLSDIEDPEKIKEVTYSGYYFNSRMIDGIVYVVANQQEVFIRPYPVMEERLVSTDMVKIPVEAEEVAPTGKAVEETEPQIIMPILYEDGEEKKIAAEDIYYLPYPDYNYGYTHFISVNLEDVDEVQTKSILSGSTSNMFVSKDSMYLVASKYLRSTEATHVFKFNIDDGEIEFDSKGEVPGSILNQFSMDEHEGYFRIATTVGHVSRTGSSTENNVYVLDQNMKTVGELEGLAPGERIYSARFMGNRCYLVTFKKVDPLFTIDLSDPYNPEVLGKLKIPGYSDYLHPYDEDHLIGIGKETVEAEQGDFAWYQGVKVSLFDVSDVENPRELAKLEIGDRGTNSNALYDHKAVLFDKSRNLLVLPISLAEIDEDDYSEDVPGNAYGEIVWQGAYVMDISLDGIEERGRISHADEDSFKKSGWYWNGGGTQVQRSLYIDDNLYTISNKYIKINDLDDLDEVAEVELPYNDPYDRRYEEVDDAPQVLI